MSRLFFNKYGIDAFYTALKQGDNTILEDVIVFLENDERTFRSGYLKQKIWRRIKRFSLDQTHIESLERAALKYLQRPMTPEFNYMCKAMCALATPTFWQTVAEKMKTGIPQEKLNASCLYPYFYGLEEGVKQRAANRKIRWEQARAYTYANVHLFEAHTPEKLIEMLHEPDHWHDGKIVRRKAKAEDLPIIYYMTEHDQEIATLDMSAVSVDVLLPKLERFLMEGLYGVFSQTAWLYIIYLMQQMNDPKVVPVLITFLQTRIDYKAGSPSKSMFESTTLKVLRHYATPEALAVVEAHRKADQEYTDHFAGKSHGWVLSYP